MISSTASATKLLLAMVIVGLFPVALLGETTFFHRGSFSAKGWRYTSKTKEHMGQSHHAKLEQEVKVGESFTLLNQVRWSYSSLYTDFSNGPAPSSKDTREIFLGDNFARYKADSWVLQTGYQEVTWGEALGFNYADVVNPRDLKETFYGEYADSKLPLFLVNFKYLGENSSLQLIYSPEPKFSKSLPLELFAQNILTSSTLSVVKEKSPAFFKEHEYGGKVAASFSGMDASLFYFSYLDREAYYILKQRTATSGVLEEKHARTRAFGGALAFTIADNFVLRTDLVRMKDKRINYLSATGLEHSPHQVTNALVSLDTPTYENFSAVVVVAKSHVQDLPLKSARKEDESYSILKVAYDFKEERTFEISYTQDLVKSGRGVQTQLLFPVGQNFDFKVGGEWYEGREGSVFKNYKSMSNVFVGMKNYFQL